MQDFRVLQHTHIHLNVFKSGEYGYRARFNASTIFLSCKIAGCRYVCTNNTTDNRLNIQMKFRNRRLKRKKYQDENVDAFINGEWHVRSDNREADLSGSKKK